MSFQLDAELSKVTALSSIQRKSSTKTDLILDGEDLILEEVKINGMVLSSSEYSTPSGKLIISKSALPEEDFTLETTVLLHPAKNLALSGLYASGDHLLCTQCEAMGFRRITFHLDRPDILSVYTVRLEAEKSRFPILLSNGNLVQSGEVEGSSPLRHWTLWEDPFPKPSYLFALVAGDLGFIKDTYTTMSGRTVTLGIYSDKGKEDYNS